MVLPAKSRAEVMPGGAERHEAGGGALEDGAEGFQIGTGGAFLEKDVAFAGGDSAGFGLGVEEGGGFLAVGKRDEGDVESGVAVVAALDGDIHAGELGTGKPIGVVGDGRERGRLGGPKC